MTASKYCKILLIVILLIVLMQLVIVVQTQEQYVESVVLDYDSALIGWIAAIAWGYDVDNYFSDYGADTDSGDGGYITSVEVSYYYFVLPPMFKGSYLDESGERYCYRVETQVWGYSEITGEDDLWALAEVDARNQ